MVMDWIGLDWSRKMGVSSFDRLQVARWLLLLMMIK
jgi:hypothetical protein